MVRGRRGKRERKKGRGGKITKGDRERGKRMEKKRESKRGRGGE